MKNGIHVNLLLRLLLAHTKQGGKLGLCSHLQVTYHFWLIQQLWMLAANTFKFYSDLLWSVDIHACMCKKKSVGGVVEKEMHADFLQTIFQANSWKRKHVNSLNNYSIWHSSFIKNLVPCKETVQDRDCHPVPQISLHVKNAVGITCEATNLKLETIGKSMEALGCTLVAS